uniref:Protein ATS1 n=1 Tax=Lygus hesperus TaxID=30085 RepID=A0A146M2R8_LYGHE
MNTSGVPIDDARKIKCLQHLTDEQVSKIKSVHVYGYHRDSAFCTTIEDEVYVAGFGGMVGVDTVGTPVLKDTRLIIPELSGMSVVKVVVGYHFGAALTAGHDLYLWGDDMGRGPEEVPARLTRLALEDHHSGAGQCAKCSVRLVPRRRGVVLWSVCPACKSYDNRVSTLPPPTSWVGRPRTLLGYKTDAAPPLLDTSFCVRCGDLKECEVEEVSSFKIVCCRSCRHPIDGNPPKIPPQTNSNIHKVTFPSPITILDILAGYYFLLLQTSEELVIWGLFGSERYNHAVLNPDNVVFAKVACGGYHVAVITDKGELYTCGDGEEGRLGYDWSGGSDGYMTLRKVELAAPAVDVACGMFSTVCLLQDGTHVVYGDPYTKVLNVGALSLNTSKSLFCVPYHAPQEYEESVESATKQLVRTRDERSVVMTGWGSKTFILLQNSESGNPKGETSKSVLDAPNSSLCSASSDSKDTGPRTESAPLSPHLSDLFRNSLLSDFTLKLADGDFTGHRSVLFASSNYFRQLLTDS